MKYLRSIYSVILLLLLGGACWSCSDDNLYPDPNKGPEGEPVTLSLNLTLPERSSYTRADLTAADDNRVNSLWVGIYNIASGEFTGGGEMTAEKNGFQAGEKNHTTYQLTNIETKSGDSRIVAVANYDNHLGVMNGVEGNLIDLLNSARTWDQFCSIAAKGALAQDTDVKIANIETPEVGETSALLMSGIFTEGAIEDHEPGYWESQANNSVYIPTGGDGQTLLTSGAIHLRRLMSHIKFTLQATGNVISIEPLSYQVFNVPTYNWLHERFSGDNINAGDALQPDYATNTNYPASLLFTSTAIGQNTTGTGNNATTQYTFDFWQMENKRTAVDGHCAVYGDRELMYGEGFTIPNPTGDPYTQSEYFYSLCDGAPSLNNKATYVDILCVIQYKDRTPNPDQTAGGTELAGNATRTANVTYRIHLGYVGSQPKANDFNSLRNSEYTYNVTVSDVKNVIVEAFREGDQTPGAIGNVTDVTDRFYDIDAHYNVFNIQFSEQELREFSFSMVAYEDNVAHEIYGGLIKGSNIPELTDPDYKYYSWIELLPTTGENVLAAYPGTTSTSILHLGDFLPKEDGTSLRSAGWYTVFVNEYVYETSSNEYNATNPAWKKYVNQPNRNVWLNVAESTSTDGNTAYYQAKYAISQKSIQTYYDVTSDAVTALGMEHTNENFGMNIRWTNIGNWGTPGPTGTLDNENGRYNAWQFASNSNGANSLWSNAVTFTSPQIVNAITNTNQDLSNIYPDVDRNPKTWYVPQVNLISSPDGSNSYNRNATDFDPQRNGNNIQYYQGYNACMNRNRDLNGDNRITPDEIRWFLPTSGQMLRIILGRNSLRSPIMDYPNKDLPHGGAQGEDVLFHFLTSDYKIIWTEEGMSSSNFSNGGLQWGRAPWEVRCVRNLGINLGEAVIRENRVGVAYESDVNSTTKGGIVKPSRYYGTALRNPSAGPLEIHKTNNPLNRVSRYGFEIAPKGNNFNGENSSEQQIKKTYYLGYNQTANPTQTQYNAYVSDVNTEFCSSLNTSTGRTGWRVPNQKEIVIMLRTTDSENNSILGETKAEEAYYSVTQEYWENVTGQAAPSMTPGPTFRFCTVAESKAQAKNLGRMLTLRCVRDLTAAEAGMSYDQITSQTRARKTKKKQ